jgi:hypothetical protein
LTAGGFKNFVFVDKLLKLILVRLYTQLPPAFPSPLRSPSIENKHYDALQENGSSQALISVSCVTDGKVETIQ